MRVEEAKFGFDMEGNPCLTAKCQVDIDETSGKFKCGFGLLKDDKGKLILFAFRDTPENLIGAVKQKEDAIKWLEKALEKNGYKWYLHYASGLEQVNGWYAFMVPFNAEGWTELNESIRNTFEDMLKMLRET
jgi:hypothetical protein